MSEYNFECSLGNDTAECVAGSSGSLRKARTVPGEGRQVTFYSGQQKADGVPTSSVPRPQLVGCP
jgi:hypothetical protein